MSQLYTTQQTLRTLADRSLRIYHRRKETNPALKLFESTLVPTIEAFKDAYDSTRNYEAERAKEVSDGRDSIRELYKEIRTCLAVVERDVRGFDSSQLMGDPEQPDNVLGDGKRLMELVSQHSELPYADAVLERIGALLPVAEQEWADAQAAIVQRQQMLAKTRDLALAAQQELVAFRKALRQVVGPRDHDYRLLRLRRPDSPVEEPFDETEATDSDAEDATNPATATDADTVTVTANAAPTPTNGHAASPHSA